MLTSKLSSKGQIVLPSSVRARLKLPAGDTLAVDVGAKEIVLRPLTRAKPWAKTSLDDVRGCLRYRGKPNTLAEMERVIAAEARRRGRD